MGMMCDCGSDMEEVEPDLYKCSECGNVVEQLSILEG